MHNSTVNTLRNHNLIQCFEAQKALNNKNEVYLVYKNTEPYLINKIEIKQNDYAEVYFDPLVIPAYSYPSINLKTGITKIINEPEKTYYTGKALFLDDDEFHFLIISNIT